MIAENVRAIRMAYGLSQEDFADALGVSSGVITNIEYNKLQNPQKKLPLLRLIAEKYSVPLEWILADNPDPLPPVKENEKEAGDFGEMVYDPVVKSFIAFWRDRTDAEKKALLKAMDDFIEILRKNQAE